MHEQRESFSIGNQLNRIKKMGAGLFAEGLSANLTSPEKWIALQWELTQYLNSENSTFLPCWVLQIEKSQEREVIQK